MQSSSHLTSGASKWIQIFVIHWQLSSSWEWKSTRIFKSFFVTIFRGKSGSLLKPYRPCMLSLNSRQPSSPSINCGIVPLEKQGKERRIVVGLEKTHKPSLLLLLPLPDGISISKLITFKIQFKPSLPSAHPKPSLLLLPDGISIRKLITFKIQLKPSFLLSANPKPSLLLLPDRISISKFITFKIQFRTFIAKCKSNVAFVSWLMRLPV